MRFNRRLDLVGGTGGYNGLWLVRHEPSNLGPGFYLGAWLDDDTVLTNQPGAGIVAFRRSSGFTIHEPFYPTNVNALCAGGGNWVGTLFVTGRPSFGLVNGGPVPVQFSTEHTIVGIDRLGNVLFRDSSSYFWVLWTDGTITKCSPPDGSGVAYYAQINDGAVLVLSNPVRLWTKHGSRVCQTVAATDLYGPCPVGDEWLSYSTPTHGRVLHRFDNAAVGYHLTDGFSPDVLLLDGQRWPAVSLGEAELSSQYRRDRPITLGIEMVPLTVSPPIPIPPEPEPGPEPPHPIPPEPSPMPTKNIAFGHTFEGTVHYMTFDEKPEGGRLESISTLVTDITDDRCHMEVTVFTEHGKEGMFDFGNKCGLKSRQDGVFVFTGEEPGLRLKSNLSRMGIYAIHKGEFGGAAFEIPGSTLYITSDPKGEGRHSRCEFMPLGQPLPSHQDWTPYDVKTGAVLPIPFR